MLYERHVPLLVKSLLIWYCHHQLDAFQLMERVHVYRWGNWGAGNCTRQYTAMAQPEGLDANLDLTLEAQQFWKQHITGLNASLANTEHCSLPSWSKSFSSKIISEQLYWDTIYVKQTVKLHIFTIFNSMRFGRSHMCERTTQIQNTLSSPRVSLRPLCKPYLPPPHSLATTDLFPVTID